jgi:hypothetical protein
MTLYNRDMALAVVKSESNLGKKTELPFIPLKFRNNLMLDYVYFFKVYTHALYRIFITTYFGSPLSSQLYQIRAQEFKVVQNPLLPCCALSSTRSRFVGKLN